MGYWLETFAKFSNYGVLRAFSEFLKKGVVETDTLQGSPKELMLGAMKMKPKFPKKLNYVGYFRDMEHLPIEAAGTQ